MYLSQRRTRAVYGASYRWQRMYTAGEQASPLFAPDALLEVNHLLP